MTTHSTPLPAADPPVPRSIIEYLRSFGPGIVIVLTWLGAAYLVWLGIKLWRAAGVLEAKPRTDAASAARLLGHAWLVTSLNPKGITFFVAFLPQFLDPHADFLTQMIVFEATFLALAFVNALGYALLAARARGLVGSPRAIGLVNRIGGSCLIGAGVAAVSVRAAP